MNFFDYIKNDSFFKPLTLKYRRNYYDCIQILIEKMKELPVLYESDAKDSITVYLKNAEIDRTNRHTSMSMNSLAAGTSETNAISDENVPAEDTGAELQATESMS